MNKGQIEKFDRAKDVEEEIPKDGCSKQKSKSFLPAYLKKVADKVDIPKNTIEELVEVNYNPSDPEKKVLEGALLTDKERE